MFGPSIPPSSSSKSTPTGKGKQNKVLAMVIAAKNTMADFSVTLEDKIKSLVYGFSKDKIADELTRLEEAKKQNELEVSGSATTFGMFGPVKKPPISQQKYEENNLAIGNARKEQLKSLPNPLKNPGIIPIIHQVQRLNSFNLCNPFTLGINAAFPPGSPVSEGIRSIQTKLKQIQDIFSNFRIIGGNKTATAESIPYPIREGEMILSISSSEILSSGTIVYIQQANDETIFTNMMGIVKSNNSVPPPELPLALQNFDPRDSIGITSATNTFDSSLSFTEEQQNLLNTPILLTNKVETPQPTIEQENFTGLNLGKLPKMVRRKLKKKGLSTFITFEGGDELQNATFTGTEDEFNAVKQIIETGDYTNPNPQSFDYKLPPLKTFSYVVEIQKFEPFDPPTQKTRNGNTVLDDDGEGVLQTFTNWAIEYESKQTTDVRELAEDLQSITEALRELGIQDIIATLNKLPNNFLGLGKLQESMLEVALFIDNQIIGPANSLADETGLAAQTLSGGLTSQEVIRRSRLLSDFYTKLEPIINFDLSLENIFEKQIKDINKTLRGVIPYEALAAIVKAIKNFVNFVIKLTDFILGILQFLNTVVKVLLVVAKVLKVIIKVIDKVSLGVPNFPITAGISNKFQDVITKVGTAVDTAIPILEEIGKALDKMIAALLFLRQALAILAGELGNLQQTFETCASLDGRKELDLNNAIQGTISAATGIPFPPNTVRQKLSDNFETYSPFDPFGNGQAASSQSQFGETLITTKDGTIIILPGTIWSFDSNGQIIFGSSLSLATGVDFNNTNGQKLRQKLRDNFTFYTFNKFKDAKYANLIESLYATSIEEYGKIVEQIRNEEPTDKFGNFQETFLGYTIRIQEEKPLQDTPIGEPILPRRRGVAFDINGTLSVASDLTFSDDLNLIVDETKFRIRRNIDQGIIGVGTIDNQNFPNDDAIKLAETIGANPLAISNIKAEANNMAANNIQGNSPIDPTPMEMRTGNEPFKEAGGEPANLIANQSSPNKEINPSSLIKQPLAEFISENPSLQKITDTMNLLQGASMTELSDIMSEPGVFNLNGEELAEKLKNNIISSIDPNPEHIEEIQKKTVIWLEGLEKQTKIDYEQLTLGMHPKQRAAFKTFEEYYDEIEPVELENWVKYLLSKKYTEKEVQSGLTEEDLTDEYKIKFNVKGKKGRMLKVQVSRRNQRLRGRIK